MGLEPYGAASSAAPLWCCGAPVWGAGPPPRWWRRGGSWRGAVPSGRSTLVSVSYSSYTLSLLFFFCIKCVVTALGE